MSEYQLPDFKIHDPREPKTDDQIAAEEAIQNPIVRSSKAAYEDAVVEMLMGISVTPEEMDLITNAIQKAMLLASAVGADHVKETLLSNLRGDSKD